MAKSAVQKAFQMEGTAERNTQGYEWVKSVTTVGRREGGWRRGRKQETLERRLETEADSGHTEPGTDPHSTLDVVSDV